MTELHQCKATMGTERATTIDFTEAQAQARAIAATINHGGMLHRTFARASQNVAATAKGHPQHSCRAACGEFGPAVGLCFHLKPSPFQGQPTKKHNSPPPPPWREQRLHRCRPHPISEATRVDPLNLRRAVGLIGETRGYAPSTAHAASTTACAARDQGVREQHVRHMLP
jgi:hypothetical protein